MRTITKVNSRHIFWNRNRLLNYPCVLIITVVKSRPHPNTTSAKSYVSAQPADVIPPSVTPTVPPATAPIRETPTNPTIPVVEEDRRPADEGDGEDG